MYARRAFEIQCLRQKLWLEPAGFLLEKQVVGVQSQITYGRSTPTVLLVGFMDCITSTSLRLPSV